VQIDPGIQLRFWEPVKIEVSVPKLISQSMVLAGQRFEMDLGPQIDLLVRVEWLDLAKEAAKRSARGLLDTLKDGLRRLVGGLFRAVELEDVLVILAGAVIAKLVLRPDEDEPIEVQPEDVSGWDAAWAFANAGRSSLIADDRFERAATEYRRTFATGFGDTLAELTKTTWSARLDDLRHARQVRSWVRLPTTASDADWIAFSLSTGKHGLESVDLFKDDFVARFRISEKAWLFAVAAHSRGRLNQDELNEARQTAKQQATVAGMAAAVQNVVRTVDFNTFLFIDEHGKPQKRDGRESWKAVVEIVQQTNLPRKVIQDRLAQLAIDHLPVLKIK
jgi:hypothetical protein